MSGYIPEELWKRVYETAKGYCQYCLLSEQYTVKRHKVDHIYAEKHRGLTVEPNLCLSCFDCNRFKGSDLCSLDGDDIVSLFHPRKHVWSEHFRLNGEYIEPLTASGRVTVQLLRMNSEERLRERRILIKLKRYP